MIRPSESHAGDVEAIRREARILTRDTGAGLAGLCEAVGDARVVLIGKATHGTREFYLLRAALTRMPVRKKGFNLVVVELTCRMLSAPTGMSPAGAWTGPRRCQDADIPFKAIKYIFSG